ncbi:hypothetical protein MMC30_006769 [Trapelia coarctata]|nr:hypothetical protein [Trapelia coarctata]
MAQQATIFPFLSLPRELRDMVYKYTLKVDKITMEARNPDSLARIRANRLQSVSVGNAAMDRHPFLRDLATYDVDASILRTCWTVHSEGVRILYTNQFVVPYELALAFETIFLRQIGSQNAAWIKDLTIGITRTDAERTAILFRHQTDLPFETLSASLVGLLNRRLPHHSLTRLALEYLPSNGDEDMDQQELGRVAYLVEHEVRIIRSMFPQLSVGGAPHKSQH